MLGAHLILTALAASPALAETVHGVLIFTRHGDRTAKYYPGYQMTNLGATQVYNSGQFYRQRFVQEGAPSKIAGISSDRVVPNEVWASAPDQAVLYQTATNFLQGVYPPLGELDKALAIETLTNGSSTTDPLNGYQFVLIHGEGDTDPDTIWIKGDDSCPAYDRASKSYRENPRYQTVLADTAGFYDQFDPLLAPIMGAQNVDYAHAYDVFDLLNVASIHNQSIASEIRPTDLDQLRYLANEWEWNHNFNATQPGRSIGGMALAGGVLRRLETVAASGGRRNKLQVMAGSYDTFLAFFGLTNLSTVNPDFTGLPNYAASMAFELFTNDGSADSPAGFPANADQDLNVRFWFRNGTESSDELTTYPLFGNGNNDIMSFGEFKAQLGGRAVNSVGQWCTMCQSEEDFCVAANATFQESSEAHSESSGSNLSSVAAGGIGAGVTLAVVAVIGGLVWLLQRKRKANRSTPAVTANHKKSVSDSEGESV